MSSLCSPRRPRELWVFGNDKDDDDSDDSLEPPYKKKKYFAYPQDEYCTKDKFHDGKDGSDDNVDPPCKKRRLPLSPQGRYPTEDLCNLNEIRTAWDNMCKGSQQFIGDQEGGKRDPKIFACKIRKR